MHDSRRTFGKIQQLFIDTFNDRFCSLEQQIIGAYDFYKTRRLDHVSDNDILSLSNNEIIENIKYDHPSTIQLLEPIYTLTKDYSNNDLIDIHIPYIGTMKTLYYCPDSLINNPPQILAELYNVKNASIYDSTVNWAGSSYTDASSIHNVLMLLFKGSEIEYIKPTLKLLIESIQQCNKSINAIEPKLKLELELAIENKRSEIKKKVSILDQMGLKKATYNSKNTEKKLIKFEFSNGFQSIILRYSDHTTTEDTFSKKQAQALEYLQNKHNEGQIKVSQLEITNYLGSVQPKIRNIFKQTKNKKTKTHPLFRIILCHDNRGNYGIVQL